MGGGLGDCSPQPSAGCCCAGRPRSLCRPARITRIRRARAAVARAAQGKDAVPETVDHVLLYVDPEADKSWLQSTPKVCQRH